MSTDPPSGVGREPVLGVDYDLVVLDHAATRWLGVQTTGPHVLRTHGPTQCLGEFCTIHNPSEHHMRTWPMNWRSDRGIMERLCPDRGIGHPDPDDMAYWRRRDPENAWAQAIHGCDGCCRSEG